MKMKSFLFLCLAGLLTGCLSRPSMNRQYFDFTTPRAAATVANAPILQIRKITVTPPFNNQPFIYRTGELSYERDAYAEFLVPPAEALMGPMRNYFPGFDVTVAGSAVKPNLVAEASVEELYGDFRNQNQPAAVLVIKFNFFDAAKGGRLLLQKPYEARVPLKSRTAAGVMAGWNEALQRIMKSVQGDLRNIEGNESLTSIKKPGTPLICS